MTAVRRVRLRLLNRLDQWVKYRQLQARAARRSRWSTSGSPMTPAQSPLMISAENAQVPAGGTTPAPFVVANSMREVQPEINLLVSPIKEKPGLHRAARLARAGNGDAQEEDS